MSNIEGMTITTTGGYTPDYKPHVDSLIQINAELRRSCDALNAERARLSNEVNDLKDRLTETISQRDALRAQMDGHAEVLAAKDAEHAKAVDALRKFFEARIARAATLRKEADEKFAIAGTARELRTAALEIVKLTNGLDHDAA